jgi:hypothetical protein
MAALTPVSVGHPFEHRRERLTHGRFAFETCSMNVATSRRLKNAVISKKLHQAIQIVTVPRISVLDQQRFQGGFQL